MVAGNHKPRILFVCYGNTCRSPMAVGMALSIFQDGAIFDSAGVVPYGRSAQPEAINLIKQEFGIDISGHIPKRVTDSLISQVDVIIALDSEIAAVLSRYFEVSSKKLLVWDIPDPFGQSIKEYQRCMEILQQQMNDLHDIIEQSP